MNILMILAKNVNDDRGMINESTPSKWFRKRILQRIVYHIPLLHESERNEQTKQYDQYLYKPSGLSHSIIDLQMIEDQYVENIGFPEFIPIISDRPLSPYRHSVLEERVIGTFWSEDDSSDDLPITSLLTQKNESVPTHTPTFTPVSTPTPIPAPIPTHTPTSIPAPTPVSIPAPISTPTSTSIPVSTPTPIPTPTPISIPAPVSTPTSTSTPVPVSTPTPTSIPSTIPTSNDKQITKRTKVDNTRIVETKQSFSQVETSTGSKDNNLNNKEYLQQQKEEFPTSIPSSKSNSPLSSPSSISNNSPAKSQRNIKPSLDFQLLSTPSSEKRSSPENSSVPMSSPKQVKIDCHNRPAVSSQSNSDAFKSLQLRVFPSAFKTVTLPTLQISQARKQDISRDREKKAMADSLLSSIVNQDNPYVIPLPSSSPSIGKIPRVFDSFRVVNLPQLC